MKTEKSRFINVGREDREIEEEQIWKECEEKWEFIKTSNTWFSRSMHKFDISKSFRICSDYLLPIMLQYYHFTPF